MNISSVSRIRALVLAGCVVVLILYIRFFMADDSLDEVSDMVLARRSSCFQSNLYPLPPAFLPGSLVRPIAVLSSDCNGVLRSFVSRLEALCEQAVGAHVRQSRIFHGGATGALWEGHGM